MGDRECANSAKRIYVDAAYAMLLEGGAESVSARDIAKRAGKTAPALYRHFESLDHLIAVASVRFLMPYYEDLRALAQRIPFPLDFSLQAWECLAYYMFGNIPLFQNLFFKKRDMSGRAVKEFFELYPEEKESMQGYLDDLLVVGTLEERDRKFLTLAADKGIISYSDVDYLADCDILILQGMLQRYSLVDDGRDIVHEATRRYMGIMVRTYRATLLPGNDLTFGTLGRY